MLFDYAVDEPQEAKVISEYESQQIVGVKAVSIGYDTIMNDPLTVIAVLRSHSDSHFIIL